MKYIILLLIIMALFSPCHQASEDPHKNGSPSTSQTQQSDQTSQSILIWFGATQTGKSSAIKLLTGNDSIVCGQFGSGASTTTDIRAYREVSPKMSKPYLHIDTIGFGDTRLNITDIAIRTKIEMEILKVSESQNIGQIRAIILTESLLGDSQQLSKNLLQISSILGYLPTHSIIILGTKWHSIAYEEIIKERENVILQTMKTYLIPVQNYLRFSTPFKYLNESSIDQLQYSKLQEIIEDCLPIQMESIRKKQMRIKAMALQLQKVDALVVQVEVNEDKIQYDIQKQVYTHRIPYEDENCLFFGMLCYTRIMWVSDIREREVKIPYIVAMKVKKNVTIDRQYDLCYQKAIEKFENETLSNMIGS